MSTVHFIAKALWSKNLRMRLSLLVVLLCGGLWVCINLFLPILLKQLTDSMANKSSHLHLLTAIPLLYGLSWTFGRGLMRFQVHMVTKISERFILWITKRKINQLFSSNLTSHQSASLGETTHLVELAQESIPKILEGLLCHLGPILLEVLCSVYVITVFCPKKYALLVVVGMVLYFFFLFITTPWVNQLQKRLNEKNAKFFSYLADSLTNFEVIKSLGYESGRFSQGETLLKEKEKVATIVSFKIERLSFFQFMIIGLLFSSTIMMAAHDVAAKQITMGDFILLSTYLLQFSFPMSYMGHILQGVRRAITGLEPLIKNIPVPWEKEDSQPVVSFAKWQPPAIGLSFKNVSFSFGNHRPILKDVTFTIKPGQKIGIVGPSGSGKTTLARLLLRTYEPCFGRITLGDQDLALWAKDSIHQTIGIVPQEALLFNDTIYENLVYGASPSEKESVDAWLDAVGLGAYISHLPQGIYTAVGERGSQLSGGERQRIGIARALLRKRSLYIFDEAMSALDAETEKKIMHNIDRMRGDATRIFVSHRLTSITTADQIFVLQNGKIIEQGHHDALLLKEGVYTSLWNCQQDQL